jgi:hypothetical protein
MAYLRISLFYIRLVNTYRIDPKYPPLSPVPQAAQRLPQVHRNLEALAVEFDRASMASVAPVVTQRAIFAFALANRGGFQEALYFIVPQAWPRE